MTYPITNVRPLAELTPDERDNVQHAYRVDTDQVSFAMVFDPVDTTESALVAHAMEMITGLLYQRITPRSAMPCSASALAASLRVASSPISKPESPRRAEVRRQPSR